MRPLLRMCVSGQQVLFIADRAICSGAKHREAVQPCRVSLPTMGRPQVAKPLRKLALMVSEPA